MSKRPSVADDDGLVPCLICGKRYKSLGPHLFRIHGMSAADYRTAYQLPASAALMATQTRETLSVARREAMKDDPELVGRMREAALDQAELTRRSAEGRARTDGLPAVVRARRRGRDKTRDMSAAVRGEAREEAATKAGFESWQEAIEATRGLSAVEAARRLGVGKTTVLRWRRKPQA